MPIDPHDPTPRSASRLSTALTAQETLARAIVANPTPLHSERLRMTAWAIAKSAFGQRVIQSRLPRRPTVAKPVSLPRPTPPKPPTGPRAA